MKRNIYILFTIGLFIRILPSHSVNLNTERLSNLKRLIENNIAYDSIAPIDSVIAWGQQLSPILEKENKMELSFSIRQLVVYIYSLRGDIGKAIDEARQMYEKAETMRYDLGIALSSAAIGDAYFCSNMPEEAIDSYKEAIRYPASPSENNHYKEMTILKLIQVLILTQRTEEAEKYRKILSESKSIQTHQTLQFLTLATDVSYYIQKNDLRNANNCLLQAEQIYLSDRQPYYRTTYNYMQGRYNEATGNYNLALQYYNEILTGIRQKTRSIIYLQVAYAKANLLIEMGSKVEAAHLYEEISIVTDSVVAPSYAHRINSLRASYEENRMKVENKAEFNRIFMGGILIGVIVLGIMIYLVIHILKQNKKIAESKIRMEQSRLNAENAMQTKRLFLSNMSHEIRTPLNAIVGFTNLLQDEKELTDEEKDLFRNTINKNSNLLLKLINDILELSRIESGRMSFAFDDCSLNELLEEIYQTHHLLMPSNIRFLKEFQETELIIHVDRFRFTQVITNFINNAVKFTTKGHILLGAVYKKEEKEVHVFVEDTGKGMSEEAQKKVFERFFKVDEFAQGTGLGLSICQTIAERLEGRITLSSQEGKGSRFTLIIPCRPK